MARRDEYREQNFSPCKILEAQIFLLAAGLLQ
jgi:hypothetical protein